MGIRSTAKSGRNASTVYGGHEHTLRQTVIAPAAGQRLEEHENPAEATVHVLHGRVRLATGGWWPPKPDVVVSQLGGVVFGAPSPSTEGRQGTCHC